MATISTDLQHLLDAQHNVISASQIAAAGLPRTRVRWLVDSGEWQRVAHGLYYAGRGPQPWLSRAWAALMIGGAEAALGSTSAAYLHDLLHPAPASVHLIVPFAKRLHSRDELVVTRSRLRRRTQSISGLRCTTVPETVLDCAQELDGHALESLIGRAFQRGLCNHRALSAALAGRRSISHRELLLAAAADAALGAHSVLEMLYLRKIERAHGLLVPERQVIVADDRTWVDIYYPGHNVIVELDGKAFHEKAPFRDRKRDNRNSRRNAYTLRYGWADTVETPCDVTLELTTTLAARGPLPPGIHSCGAKCCI